jgi:hypothetical protein
MIAGVRKLPSGKPFINTEGKSNDEISALLSNVITEHRTLPWTDLSVKTQVRVRVEVTGYWLGLVRVGVRVEVISRSRLSYP